MGKIVVMVVIALLAPWTLMATHVPSSTETITYDGSLSPGTAASGVIGWADPIDGYDWYCFDAKNGTALSVTVTRTNGDIFPNTGLMQGLADPANPKAALTILKDTSNSTDTSTKLDFTPTADGPVTLWVSTFLGEKQGGYTVTMTGGSSRSGCGAVTAGPSGPLILVSVPETEYFTSNDQTIKIPVSVQTVSGFGQNVTLNLGGLPEDVTSSFAQQVIPVPGNGRTDLSIKVGALTLPNTYVANIVATGGEATGGTTFLLTIDCGPPLILGIDQPKNTSVNRGGTAKLTVKPSGTGPFFYQWYSGYSGLTAFPIKSGTSATLTTPPITNDAPFWVRVTNACGSVDSRTVTVTSTGFAKAPEKE